MDVQQLTILPGRTAWTLRDGEAHGASPSAGTIPWWAEPAPEAPSSPRGASGRPEQEEAPPSRR